MDELNNSPKTHVHSTTPLPPIRRATIQIDGSRILYFSVSKSADHVHLTSDGRCLQRKDLRSDPISPANIILDRRERASRDYDRQYIDGATAADLNTSLVKSVADQLSAGMSVERYLQYLDLAEYIGPGLRLRRAALLLFAAEPNRWHPRLQIRILKIHGGELRSGANYNVKSDQTVVGNILELLERGWESLRPQLVQTRLAHTARFETTIMYPELACREALVNAIAHRDYADEGRGIEIYVFDDRMEVRNPGALLTTLTVEDLLKLEGAHQSRNAIVARVLRELGYMRELGEGMRRMFQLMSQNELTPPELSNDSQSFCVTLKHKTIYSQEQVLWLDQFNAFALNREQKAIVSLGRGGKLISPQDIWDNLGIVDTDHFRKLVNSLQRLGILTSEVPKTTAQNRAKRQQVSVREIPRFRINPPKRNDFSALVVETRAQPIADREDATPDAPDLNAELWIGNLDEQVQDSELLELLSPFGSVEKLYVARRDGLCKGYAFAEFSDVETSIAARPSLNNRLFRGRRIIVRFAKPRF